MRNLIIGASCQLWVYLWNKLNRDHEDVVGTYYSHPVKNQVQCDFTDMAEVTKLIQDGKPDVVWIPAALPDVDRCEREPELSYVLNVKAPRQVGEVARDNGAKLVFFSTDYVFDGTSGPYRETDVPNPLQVYGKHKAEAEEFLIQNAPDVLIIRPAWIYSEEPNPRNFVFRILQQLKDGHTVRAAIDQINTPTDSRDLVERALAAVNRGDHGIRHMVGPDRLSRYDLTLKIAKDHGFSSSMVEPITTASLNLPARRPLNGGLVTIYARGV